MKRNITQKTAVLLSLLAFMHLAAFCASASERNSTARSPETKDPVKYEAARSQISQANRLFLDGKFSDALSIVDRSLAGYETFEGYFLKGSIMYRLNRVQEALDAYLRAENIRPNDEQLLLSIAVVYTGKGDLENAQKRYVKLVEVNPKEPIYTFKAGTGYKLLRDYEKAYASLKLADVPSFRYRDQLYLQLGDVCLELKKYDEAENYFREAKKINPKLEEASTGDEASRIARVLEKGNTAFQEKRYEEALKYFEEGITASPDSSGPYLLAATALLALERYEESKAKLLRAIELNPADSKGYSLLGSVYHKMREYQKALAAFKSGTDVAPDSAELFNKTGLVYRDLGETRKSIDAFRKSVQLNPSYAPARINLALAYLDDSRYEESKTEFSAAQELDSDNASLKGWEELVQVRILLDRGDRFFQNNKMTQASAEYTKALRIRDDLPVIQNALGRVELQRRHYSDAVRFFNKALEIDAANVPALQGLIRAYAALNKNREKEETLAKLTALTRNSPDAAIALGRLKEDQGQLREAETYYLNLLKEKDQDEIKRRLGIVYYKLGLEENKKENFPGALQNFQKAQTYNPDISQLAETIKIVEENIQFADQIPILKRAERLFAERKYAEAVVLYEEVHKKFSRPLILVKIANCYMSLGQEEKGLRILEEAGKTAPEDLEIAEAVYTYLMKKGELDKAEAGFKQILEAHEDAYYSLYKLGIIEIQKKDPDDAIEYLTRSLIYRPDFMVAHVALGVAYYDKGDRVKAREEFDTAVKNDGQNGSLAMFNIGVMYYNENLLDKAEQIFLDLARNDSDFADPHYHLSYIHFNRGNMDRAEREMKLCMSMANDEKYYYAMTQIYEKKYTQSKNPRDAAALRQAYQDLILKHPASHYTDDARRKLLTLAPDRPVVQAYPSAVYQTGPVLYAGAMIGVRNGSLSSVENAGQQTNWSVNLEETPSMILADRLLYVLYPGRLDEYDIATGRKIGSFAVERGTAITGGFDRIGVSSSGPAATLSVYNNAGNKIGSHNSSVPGQYYYTGGSFYVLTSGELTRLDANLAAEKTVSVNNSGSPAPAVSLQQYGEKLYLVLDRLVQIFDSRTMELGGNIALSADQEPVFNREENSVKILISSTRKLSVYDADGEKVQEIQLRNPILSPRAVRSTSNGRFFYISSDGKVRLIDSKGAQTWESALPASRDERSAFSLFY